MRTIHQTILLGVFLAMASGCATPRRSVTHIRVEKDNAYIAYAEWDEGFFGGSNDRSRVKHCTINPDNTLKCQEDADINQVLNPQETQAPAASTENTAPAAPEEEAGATGGAEEETEPAAE